VRSLLRPALLLALKDLRQRFRDRSALILAFVAPFGIAAIISVALGGTGRFHATFAVADEDGRPMARAFIDNALRAPALADVVTIELVTTAEEARKRTAAGKVSAALIIPAGFSNDISAGRQARIQVLRNADSPIGGELAQTIASQFPPSPAHVIDGNVGSREVRQASYFGPSMAIFFLFFVVEFGAVGILAERRTGTLARLLAAPISREAVVVGKALSTFALGAISLGTMMVATTMLLGASWGDPLAVAALGASIVLAAMGITALTATFASSEQNAGAFSSMVSMGLSMLGGNFVPIAQAPDVMRTIALATPNGLALRGFTDLVADGGNILSVLPHVGGIFAFALITGAIAVRRARNLVTA
jgi:ABC-2 type transport system permease protein